MKKWFALFIWVWGFQAFADLSNNNTYIFDSSGNSLNSTSNALNSFLTNSTLAVTQSGSWTNSCTQGTSPWVANISQFGGSSVVTGTGNSGSGIPRVTISNDSSLTNISGTISLPTGASSSSNQTNGSQKTQVVDGSGNVQPSGDSAARKIFTQPTDGTNSQGYTASSEAKVSVTQPLPAGSNIIGNVRIDQTTSGTTNGVVVNSGSITANAGTNLNTSALNLETTQSGFKSANHTDLTQVDTDLTAFKTANHTDLIGTQPRNITQFGGTNMSTGTGVSGAGIPRVTVSSDSSITANAGTNLNTSLLALQSGANSTLDRATTGTLGALNANAILDTHGMSLASLSISGTWVGTISFQGSNDGGSTYPFAADGIVIPSGAVLTFVSSNAQFKIPCGSFDHVRIIMTSYTSGSASILLNSGVGSSLDRVFSTNASSFLATSYTADGSGNPITSQANGSQRPLDVGINVSGVQIDPRNLTQVNGSTVNTGTGASSTGTQRVAVANDSQIKVWDGTNNSTVKAASTQAALTDTAVVITGRPDNVGTPTQTSVSCASTSTTLLAASTATMFLSVRNPTTSTQTIWINVTGAAAVPAAPSIDLAPGSEADFFAEGASFLPTAQINCISGGTASTVTVVYK